MEIEENGENSAENQLINIILSIVNWEINKENILKAKDNKNKKKSLYLINKEFYNNFKELINYPQLISNLHNKNINSKNEIENIINVHINNNINQVNKDKIKLLFKQKNNINEDLIMKQIIENINFIFEIINEDIKNNMNFENINFIKLENHNIENEIYFTMEESFNNNKFIILLLKSEDKDKLYEIIFIVENNNYKDLINIIEEEKIKIIDKCGINLKEINQNNLKKINLSNITFALLITIIKQFTYDKTEEVEKNKNNIEQNLLIKKRKKIVIKKEKILNLLSFLNNSNILFKKALNQNEGEMHNNYSPCKIINRIWTEKFITVCNNLENIDPKNIDIFDDYKMLIPSEINNDNIYIINEIFFISLFPFFDELEKNRDSFNDNIIYLKNDKGAIVIEDEIFIFETIQNDINLRKFFIKIQEPNLFLEEMKEDNFEFNEDNWKKLKLNTIYDDSLENNINDTFN